MPISEISLLAQGLKRSPETHKGRFGTVLIIGGDTGMVGGLVLAGLGALYSGAGLVKLLALAPESPPVITNHPELMVYRWDASAPEQAIQLLQPSVMAIGPGLGRSKGAYDLLERALKTPLPLVIDADAINLLALHRDALETLRQRSAATILTPHPGEAARLLQETTEQVQANRSEALEALVRLTQATVILKGHQSRVLSPEGQEHSSASGNPGMASGGMGDVLTGLIGALLAQGLPAFEAAVLAQELHSQAADRLVAAGIGPNGLTASELPAEIRRLLNEILAAPPA